MPRRQGFIVWLFTPGSFLKIKQLAQFFGILFSTEQVVKILILAKHGLGYILGSFFSHTHLVSLFSTILSLAFKP
jgi:hypothetical protein